MPQSVGAIADIILRSGAIYVVLIVVFRLAGKRHFSQLSLIDFILLLLVSNAVQNGMVGEDTSISGAIVSALTLISINIIITKLSVKNKFISKIVEGEPKLLLRDGKIIKKAIENEGLSRDEVQEAVRKAGYAEISDAAFAILETDGSISVIGKEKISLHT